jgi:hypothetical protein
MTAAYIFGSYLTPLMRDATAIELILRWQAYDVKQQGI